MLPPGGGATELLEPWDDLLCFHSFTLPEEPVHGGSQQTASPPGGLLHALVPLLLTAEPPPGLLPAGGLQQHHPVSV